MNVSTRLCAALLSIGLSLGAGVACAEADFDQARSEMLDDIRRMAQDAAKHGGAPVPSKRVLSVLDRVPRHEFVPSELERNAYDNRPLPIGNGQTISQPYIVALMTELAGVDDDAVVLEIGTGSGYQAAVLSGLASEVYTIEIVEALGLRARATLERLGYDNVHVKIGDGYAGWPEHAPFDAIVVTAAPENVPQPLIEQLNRGGKLVIPVGPQYGAQYLKVLTKDDDGEISTDNVIPVAFVPFTRSD